MSVAAASASATLTADEIIVEAALGGLRYCLASFSKTVNLAMTGAGGMDTGAAPASGYVALYAIYNPTTGASALLATNATSAVAPSVYGGANMPTGYTASALMSVWPTNGSGQFVTGYQRDRTFYCGARTAFTVTAGTGSYTSISVSGSVPQNAKRIFGSVSANSNTSQSLGLNIAGDSSGAGFSGVGANGVSCAGSYVSPIITPQTIYYLATGSSGTLSFVCNITSYEI
ncbi:phage tail protein [Burkholderia ubonensis]|nr:phage tail protein [Burkholderia ubonensis]KWB94112.1 phage tail protein [Burkholderia ubonensis]KWC17479.1 phage tail protein [Burkholderia ubonensis]